MLSYPDSLVLLSAAISMPYLSNFMATSVVCFSGRCAAVLTISVRTFHTARYKATSFLFLLSSPSLPFTDCRSENRSAQILFFRPTSEPAWVRFWWAISWRLLAKRFEVLLVIAGLLAHTWQKEGLSLARTCLDRPSLSSVAVTDQRIGLFVPSFWCLLFHTNWHGSPQTFDKCRGVLSHPSGPRAWWSV